MITRPKLINQHEQKFVWVHLPILDFSCSNSIRSDISSAITRPSMLGVLSMMIVLFCVKFGLKMGFNSSTTIKDQDHACRPFQITLNLCKPSFAMCRQFDGPPVGFPYRGHMLSGTHFTNLIKSGACQCTRESWTERTLLFVSCSQTKLYENINGV